MSLDPKEAAAARARAAGSQFGAALSEQIDLSLRLSVVKRLTVTHGPGPWILFEDGTAHGAERVTP